MVRIVNAYVFVTTGSSKDNFPWMMSHPRNNSLHRLVQTSIEFYLMILQVVMIYESLAGF